MKEWRLTFLLALFFAAWAFRGSHGGSPLDPDAARHMLNGAFIYDALRTGNATHAAAFAQTWYARLPALSLPYHPPGFPLIESAFYAIFGVRYETARLAVALSIAACILLFVRLMRATGATRWISVSAVLIFFSAPATQSVSTEVMLEFPALVFTLLALYTLRDLAQSGHLSWGSGLSFALNASVAIWTRQNTAFLVAVPLLIAVANRSWPVARRGAIWICSLIPAASFALIEALPRIYGVGLNTRWHNQALPAQAWHHALQYEHYLANDWGWMACLPAVALAGYGWLCAKRDPVTGPAGFWLVASIAAIGLHLAIPPWSERYAFFWNATLVVFTLLILHALLRRRLGPGQVDAVILGAGVLYFGVHIRQPAPYLYGLGAAARSVVGSLPSRVVYIGPNNGAFIAAVRTADPDLRTTVIRADKLPVALMSEEFLRRYGIAQIVVAPHAVSPAAEWMRLSRQFRLESSDPGQAGLLKVYEFPNPSPHPENVLDVFSSFSPTGMRLILP